MGSEQEKTSEIRNKIEKALDSIRPYLQTDGGNVRVLDISDNLEVKLELLGNCGNCPMSTMTLKAGVEDAIKRAAPEVSSVVAINITAPGDPGAKLPENLR